MNINQLAKLKELIATSPLLSGAERVEWNGLLELMNDKQLNELEKILGSEPASKPISLLAGQPATETVKPSPTPQMPKLSHLVNLPRIGGSGSKPVSESVNKPVSLSAGQTILPAQITAKQENKKSGFSSKLKALFSEKELTTSKPEYPLEIPEHVDQPVVKKEPVAVIKPQEEKQTVHLPEVAKRSPIKAPTKEIEELLKKIPKPGPKPEVDRLKSMSDVAIEATKVEKMEKTVPGVNLSGEEKGVRDLNLEKLKQDFRAKDTIDEVESEIPLNKNIAFKDLADLSKLSYKLLDDSDLDALVKKIKEFINRYGYFEVVFNIEESPLFKAYLNTGLKLMAESKDFVELDKTPSIEKFMNKHQFEKFTDLLAKIQGA